MREGLMRPLETEGGGRILCFHKPSNGFPHLRASDLSDPFLLKAPRTLPLCPICLLINGPRHFQNETPGLLTGAQGSLRLDLANTLFLSLCQLSTGETPAIYDATGKPRNYLFYSSQGLKRSN